ncbi:hypothetical protein BKA81DRAFT_64004 [Phyllosticta paracitricarpa]
MSGFPSSLASMVSTMSDKAAWDGHMQCTRHQHGVGGPEVEVPSGPCRLRRHCNFLETHTSTSSINTTPPPSWARVTRQTPESRIAPDPQAACVVPCSPQAPHASPAQAHTLPNKPLLDPLCRKWRPGRMTVTLLLAQSCSTRQRPELSDATAVETSLQRMLLRRGTELSNHCPIRPWLASVCKRDPLRPRGVADSKTNPAGQLKNSQLDGPIGQLMTRK